MLTCGFYRYEPNIVSLTFDKGRATVEELKALLGKSPVQSMQVAEVDLVSIDHPLVIRGRFLSKRGLVIEVVELSDCLLLPLVAMYENFEPKRVAQGLPPPGRDRILIWLKKLQNDGENLVALSQGCLIGHTMLCAVSQIRAEFAIFIHQEFRNQGIGTKLTELTMQFAKEKGYQRIWLSVEVNNLVAIRVYKKLGFRLRDLFGPEQEMEVYL